MITPQQLVAKLKDKATDEMSFAERDLVQRDENCVGLTIKGIRGTCIVCKKETDWYCVGCHQSFCCAGIGANVSPVKEVEITLGRTDGKALKVLNANNSCWWHHHGDTVVCMLCKPTDGEVRRVLFD